MRLLSYLSDNQGHKWCHSCYFQLALFLCLTSTLEGGAVSLKQGKPCQSVDALGKSVPGQCIRFILCPRLLDFAKQPTKTLADFRLLKTLTCGFRKDEPLICCPLNDIYHPPGRDDNTGPSLTLSFPEDDSQESKQVEYSKNDSSSNFPPPMEKVRGGLIPRLQDCGEPRQDFTGTRIIGGSKSTPGQFPFMALLYRIDTVTDEEEFYCAGTIINQHYILTAAHCVVTNEGSAHKLAYVQVGVTDVTERCHQNSQRECGNDRRYEIAAKVVHPKYVFGSRDRSHDIALLRTAQAMNFKTKFIRPVCLPFTRAYGLSEKSVEGLEDQEVDAPEIGRGIVVGWGRDSNVNPVSTTTMKYAHLPILSPSECQSRYGNQAKITEKQMCAGGQIGTDTCVGDSGGPLLIPFETTEIGNKWEQRFTGKLFQTGIISFGPSHCGIAGGKPSVYTKVMPYIEWILDSMHL